MNHDDQSDILKELDDKRQAALIRRLDEATLATSLGFMVPYLLQKAGMDQAAGADPVITTIKDVTGLLIYFLLVNTFLGLG